MSNVARWRKFPVEKIAQIVKESRSFREVANKLGYSKDGGGTITSMHKMCEELNLDTSHFLGQAWNKENYDYDLFASGYKKKNGSTTLNPLIKLRGRKCECCGLTDWLGQPITLEIHHIDGNHENSTLENLQLLCPNCHSYTPGWRRKKRASGQETSCMDVG